MENEVIEDRKQYEHKPGFSLAKYGSVLAFNFNKEFGQRLINVLADFHKNYELQEPTASLFKEISYHLELPSGYHNSSTLFKVDHFQHVFSVCLEREAAVQLNDTFARFLNEKRVSVAMFSFAKQLDGFLNRRFEPRSNPADEF